MVPLLHDFTSKHESILSSCGEDLCEIALYVDNNEPEHNFSQHANQENYSLFNYSFKNYYFVDTDVPLSCDQNRMT